MYVVVLRWTSKRRLGRIALVRFTFLAVTRGAGSWPGQRGMIVRMVTLATSWPERCGIWLVYTLYEQECGNLNNVGDGRGVFEE